MIMRNILHKNQKIEFLQNKLNNSDAKFGDPKIKSGKKSIQIEDKCPYKRAL